MMGEPRTTREALIAQMMGELDHLFDRAERLPDAIATAEARVAGTVKILDEAGDRFRMAVTKFTEDARAELTEHLQNKAAETTARTIEQQRAMLQEAARAALRVETSGRIVQLENRLVQTMAELRRSKGTRLMEHGLTALLSSLLTAGLVLLIVRF